MSTVILFTTKYGTAEKCAGILKEEATGETIAVNLAEQPGFSVTSYDTVVLGASVYIEKIQKEMTIFCKDRKEELLTKNLGLYICSGNTRGTYYLKLFGKELYRHAASKKMFGSEIYWKKMNPFERLITRVIKKTKASSSNLENQAISDLAEEMKL